MNSAAAIVATPTAHPITLLASGREQDSSYSRTLEHFDWEELFAQAPAPYGPTQTGEFWGGQFRFFQAATDGIHRRGRHSLEKRVDAATEVDLVVGELDRRWIGSAILEAQRADASLDRIGCRDLCGHVGRVLRRSGGRTACGRRNRDGRSEGDAQQSSLRWSHTSFLRSVSFMGVALCECGPTVSISRARDRRKFAHANLRTDWEIGRAHV